MMSRLFAAVLAALLPDRARRRRRMPNSPRLARGSGTPDIPGLKMVWLAPWGDLRNAHPWRNIIVHQTEGPAGLGARRRAGAVEEPDPARRHGLGRDRRHGLLGGRGEPGADPWRRRQPQRQQVHRQQADLPPGRARQLDRRRVRRQLSRCRGRSDRGAGRGLENPRPGPARRYGIPLDRVYAHNWIDYKDARYCEGCWLATLARTWGE